MMNVLNIIYKETFREPEVESAFQYDYGKKLQIMGLTLPSIVEAHFALDERGTSILRMGTWKDGIATIPIPDSCLENAGMFYCYIFDRQAVSGRTVYKIAVNVQKRADLPEETENPTEEDVSYFELVLSSVSDAVSAVEATKESLLNGIQVGTVETLPAGSDASVDLVEKQDGSLALNFGIPQGAKGEQGEGGGVGENTTGQSVTYDGTEYTCEEGAERFNEYEMNHAVGKYAHSEGYDTMALGKWSHSEGGGTHALDEGAHAEGIGTKATAPRSHAEGWGCTASGQNSHAEGSGTTASGTNSHSEGGGTTASAMASHAEGSGTKASSEDQHTQGKWNIEDAHGKYADIVGNGTSGARSNCETTSWTGIKWLASDVRCGGGDQDNAPHSLSGEQDKVTFDAAPTENSTNPVTSGGIYEALANAGGGVGVDAEGMEFTVEGETLTGGVGAEYFNSDTNIAVGSNSHAEGSATSAIGADSHAEGSATKAKGLSSHSEGSHTWTSKPYAHAEGYGSSASGECAHAEGYNSSAYANYSHAENKSIAQGEYSHAENDSGTVGAYSHAEGATQANGRYSHTQGKYNVIDNAEKYVDIIGGGTSKSDRKNIETVDWTGKMWLATDVLCGGSDQDDTAAISLTALAQKVAALEARVAALES